MNTILRVFITLAAVIILNATGTAQDTGRRTGLISERGLTAANFPQHKKLADNVYVWTDVHPSGLYVTNNLIVVTSDGVLVARSEEHTSELQSHA